MQAPGAQRRPQPQAQVFFRQRPLLEELFHQLVVALGHHLDQGFVGLLGGVGELGGDVAHRGFAGAIALVAPSLHSDQVNQAAEAGGFAERQGHRHDAPPEALREGAEGALEAGVVAVHLADDENAGQLELDGVVPDFFRHHFGASHRVHEDERAVGGHQRRLGVVDEEVVAGRVDEVELDFLSRGPALRSLGGGGPLGVRERRPDGNLARDFFFVEVGHRLALVHPPQALDEPGGVQAGGDQRGLAGVAVAGDPDGADGFSRIHLHRILPLEACLPAASFSLTGLRVTFPPTCPEPSRGKPAG